MTEINERIKQRSWPGRGDSIELWVGDSGLHGDMLADLDGDAIVGNYEAEDFSKCGWPVCVKVKIGADKTNAAGLLRKIADVVERRTRRDAA